MRTPCAILISGALASCQRDPAGLPPQPPSVVSVAPPAASAAAPTASATALAAPPEAVLPAPALVADALYAPLFEKNRTWSFQERWKRSRYDGVDSAHGQWIREEGARTLVCRVEAVNDHGEYVQSFIGCTGQGPAEDEEADHPVASQWVASKKGLFRMGAEFCDEPDAHTDLRVMERVPRASRSASRDGVVTRTSTVAREGEAWCWRVEHGGGDPSWSSLCFEEARGFASGTYGWTGGTTHETTFSRAPEP